MSIIVGINLKEAIDKQPEETQKDMRKLLDLKYRAGDYNYILLTPLFGPVFAVLLLSIKIILIVLSIAIIGIISYWLYKRRKRAQQDYHQLIASNSQYWEPIDETLNDIILQAGQIDNGFWITQKTKLTGR